MKITQLRQLIREEIKSVRKTSINENIESFMDEDNQGLFIKFPELEDTDDEGDLYISMDRNARDEMYSEGGSFKGEIKIGNKKVYWSWGYA